ncbi:MAG: hypothetical protein ACR2PZ_22060, partial [Pseudomonadales bacterium]
HGLIQARHAMRYSVVTSSFNLWLAALLFATSLSANVHDPKALAADPKTASSAIAPTLAGLGQHHHAITTSSEASQAFFDQGLRLTYAFNHSEALRAFKEAARLDPNNAMAYWGWGLVLGPNINLPMVAEVNEQAFAATQRAITLIDGVQAHEQALINALAARYSPVAPDDRSSLDQRYADAMAAVHAQFPDDADIATLYAAAMMNLSPWDYWKGSGEARKNTKIFLPVLQQVIDSHPEHPGALHYYIHTVEAVHPARGEAAADALAGLMPNAGHMVHMPSHIYMRLGRYADSYKANVNASLADERYVSQCRAQGIYPLNYYPHNLHFMVWSAMFQGRSAEALAAARKVQAKVPKDMQGNAFAAFETFMSQPLYVMVRFADWQGILEEPEPASSNQFMLGVWHYARGMAYANSKQVRRAKGELKQLEKLRKSIADDYFIGFGTAPTLLYIAEELLSGDILAKQRRYDDAIAHIARAVRLEDGLLYNEPPDWYFPTRHVLGAVLLDAGQAGEAETVYWQDLRKNPGNAFSLTGLLQALKAQGKTEAAAEVATELRTALAEADVSLASSRF